ncbi:MAG: hypothetical protein AAF151_09495 [Cyanobacteria bacterium J06656_5]
MSSKFFPKFTIATAYSMMYCPSDLQYLESKMINIINADATSDTDMSKPISYDVWDAVETTADSDVWVQNNESQKKSVLIQLERLWQNSSKDSPH